MKRLLQKLGVIKQDKPLTKEEIAAKICRSEASRERKESVR